MTRHTRVAGGAGAVDPSAALRALLFGTLVVPALWAALLAPSSAEARFDPNTSRRMGISDHGTSAGLQPRAWVTTVDGELVAKRST